MKKSVYQIAKMKAIFEARTNNYIKETAKEMIRIYNEKNWTSNTYEMNLKTLLQEEKLERIWRNLYQWKLPKNITISGKDEYFLI